MTLAPQPYLNTRVSAMSERLLTSDQIAALCELSLPDLAERFGLEALLDEQLDRRTKSRAVKQALINTLLDELRVLIRPMNATEAGLVLAWGRKYALFNLKTLLRGQLYELDQSEISANLYELPAHVRLPQQELFRAEGVLELLRKLEQGPYSLIARQGREVFEQKREPFALEAALDQRYYGEMVRRLLQVSNQDGNELKQLLGAVLDRVGLLWLLRFRFSYGLSPSETYYQLVPSVRLLHRDRLLRLVNLETFDEILAALPEPLTSRLAGSTSLMEVQRRLGGHVTDEARRTLANGQSGVARALAYLILREHGVLALFSIVQGQLLGLPRELIEIAVEVSEPNCPADSLADAA
ncbi:V0D/AC39 family V-type ATPase subunit [Halochromatium glycolicum]|jgi:V/A-type H+-transporting ATPase subunit C|uniref:ATPase n=1 Tax=Halochromatium glycolicum TaxID=85075 RepID=A0AAJ0U2M6_9GAMM|nr:V-type ATPase subunit [Halochromatium glycolicum]MBK1703720.1 ATPase [Halochromatium glycolicum]